MAPKWQAKGDYFETCNCQTLCPCIFLSPPTDGDCSVLVGWHIESGKFGDASLDGLNVAALFHSPGPMYQGNWSAALYLDSRASDQQSDALTKIFSGQAGGAPAALHPLISKVLGVKSAEIAYHANGRTRRMTIRDVGESESKRWRAPAARMSRLAITRSQSHQAIRASSRAQSSSSFATTGSRLISQVKADSSPHSPMKAEP